MHFFRVTVRSSKSLGVLFVRFKRSRRQRERKRKFQTRGCLFHSHKRRFFFDFGPKILFSTMLGSVFLFHRKKKKKFCQRERDVAAEKRERFSCFSLKRHTYKNHASSSHITTGVLSSLRFNDTFSATLLFVSKIQRQKKQRRRQFFVPSFRDAVYTCS